MPNAKIRRDVRESCETCRFWKSEDHPPEDLDEGQSVGYCRRFPPSANHSAICKTADEYHELEAATKAVEEVDMSFHWCFPTTVSDDWCGEHQPRIALPLAPT